MTQNGLQTNEKANLNKECVCFSTESRYTMKLVSIKGIMRGSIKEWSALFNVGQIAWRPSRDKKTKILDMRQMIITKIERVFQEA